MRAKYRNFCIFYHNADISNRATPPEFIAGFDPYLMVFPYGNLNKL